MSIRAGIEARLMWHLLFCGTQGLLQERDADYSGMLERMEAAELLSLIDAAKARLESMHVSGEADSTERPVELFIDRNYTIRTCTRTGCPLPLRPLVRALFILFLRHPEGILLKRRDQYRFELEDIYATILPNTDKGTVKERVGRLMNLQDNSFSEKTSVLNARLEELLPKGAARNYQIQGYNGRPRRIPLNPLLVHWE